ncbi:MAG: nuclear transport factor 2 family protein [Gammaproteobacteria bacterium]|nr:nuclear transport factor 2 family protein [Gammaproteobacteria bacterium]
MSNPRPRSAPWSLRSGLAGFVAGALLILALTSVAEQTYTWGEQYRTIPARYQKMIDDSELAFTKRDVAASGTALTEDFSWYTVKEDGPKEMVRGREATMARLKVFFESPMWTTNDSEVHRLGMVGNTLVQVEIDSLQMNDKPVRQTSLHVYEFRDGKRWREFAFYPTDL